MGMLYRKMPRTNWSVSIIGMGCWAIGGQWGPVSDKTALATIDRALELGVNLFDTADTYGVEQGTSEKLVGQALKNVRSKVFIASKVGNWGRRMGQPLSYSSTSDIYQCFDASLSRLQTDYLDLYQCHIGGLEDPSIFLEAFETLTAKKKIRAYGISTNEVDVLKRFNGKNSCTVCQLDYSMVNRKPEKELLPFCKENQIGTLVRGPLAQGLLTGKFSKDVTFTDTVREKWNPSGGQRAQFVERMEKIEKWKSRLNGRSMTEQAIQFSLSDSATTCVIPGAKSPEQIEELAKAGSSLLSADDLKIIRENFS